jgi:hypothetical protein
MNLRNLSVRRRACIRWGARLVLWGLVHLCVWLFLLSKMPNYPYWYHFLPEIIISAGLTVLAALYAFVQLVEVAFGDDL